MWNLLPELPKCVLYIKIKSTSYLTLTLGIMLFFFICMELYALYIIVTVIAIIYIIVMSTIVSVIFTILLSLIIIINTVTMHQLLVLFYFNRRRRL